MDSLLEASRWCSKERVPDPITGSLAGADSFQLLGVVISLLFAREAFVTALQQMRNFRNL